MTKEQFDTLKQIYKNDGDCVSDDTISCDFCVYSYTALSCYFDDLTTRAKQSDLTEDGVEKLCKKIFKQVIKKRLTKELFKDIV